MVDLLCICNFFLVICLKFYASFNTFYSYLCGWSTWMTNKWSPITNFFKSDQILIPHDFWISDERHNWPLDSMFEINFHREISLALGSNKRLFDNKPTYNDPCTSKRHIMYILSLYLIFSIMFFLFHCLNSQACWETDWLLCRC